MKTRPFSWGIVLVFLSLLLLPQSTFSQTYYALQIDRNTRFKAADITAAYQPRLVMGPDQALEFKHVVAKFLVKKKAIEKDDSLSPKAKYELFQQLSSR